MICPNYIEGICDDKCPHSKLHLELLSCSSSICRKHNGKSVIITNTSCIHYIPEKKFTVEIDKILYMEE